MKLLKLLENLSKAIDEFVNFGTHILKWLTEEQKGGDELLPLIMLLRHYIEIVDSISNLVKVSSIDPCKILLRAALETSFNINYLLESNTHNRAMAFLVWHSHKMINTYKKLDFESEEGKKLQKAMDFDKSLSYSTPDDSIIKSTINSYQSLLSKPEYALAEESYQSLLRKKEKNPSWHRLFDGPKNIEELARYLNSSGTYETLYRHWSGPVHGTDIIQGKLLASDNGSPEIVQIRYFKDVQIIVKFTLSTTKNIYDIITDSALPAKKQDFNEWYTTVEDFFKRILSNKPLIVFE